jgi:F420-dependent oxidoreductase-like protein
MASNMRIGVFIDSRSIDEFVSRIAGVREAGFGSAWAPQIFGLDALTALAVAGREVPDIQLGTAVVPTYPRHPMTMALQALTTQAAIGGRLNLGIGLSHQMVVENMWGISFERPARHMKEYLSALMPMLHDRSVSFKGETLTAMGQLQLPPIDPPPVLVAALGERMLRIAGRLADGTATWMTGARTIGDHIVPHITKAAEAAGRPAPRVAAALPVAVTSDATEAREKAATIFAIYGHLPSYRAMLDREGAEGPANVAIVGDEATVKGQIEAIFEAGATEFVVVPFVERERTLEFAATLL